MATTTVHDHVHQPLRPRPPVPVGDPAPGEHHALEGRRTTSLLVARPPAPRATFAPGRSRLQHRVDLLPALLPGVDHASITTVAGGHVRVRAASDATGRRTDELQDELAEGPCLQAVRSGHSVVGHDLRTETRWRGWCAAATGELGLASVLSVLLPPTLGTHATLNLGSDTSDGLVDVDLALLHTLAAPLVDALRMRLGIEELGPAA